jgi:hypothetical protein
MHRENIQALYTFNQSMKILSFIRRSVIHHSFSECECVQVYALLFFFFSSSSHLHRCHLIQIDSSIVLSVLFHLRLKKKNKTKRNNHIRTQLYFTVHSIKTYLSARHLFFLFSCFFLFLLSFPYSLDI